MKCGKKSAQKLISEIEKEKKNVDWLIVEKNFSETGWKSGNEWNVNVKIKIMMMNEMWTDKI